MTKANVKVFIDWDTARRIVPPDVRRGRQGFEGRAIYLLQDAISHFLVDTLGTGIYRVTLRLYHGWYSGKTRSPDRRAIDEIEPRGRVIGRVSFTPNIEFSDRLMCGGPRSELFDTIRKTDGVERQKMVDTALVSDLLHFVRARLGDVAIVLGNDDDLLPGAITAEMWGGCKVLVARFRTDDNKSLNTSGLIYRLRSER